MTKTRRLPRKNGAPGPRGPRGPRGATGQRGRTGKLGHEGPSGSLQKADVLDGFVSNFDDVYRQMTGLMKLIGQMQRQINELIAKAR